MATCRTVITMRTMSVQASPPSPVVAIADPVDFLLMCHARIRSFTEVAGRLAEADRSQHQAIAETARACERFFRVALPMHAEDEDLSVAPRLRATCADPEVIDAVAKMNEQHPRVDREGFELADLLRAIADDPASLALRAAELRDRARALDELWLDHLGTEERLIFPALHVALPTSELAQVMAECRARRAGVAIPPDPPCCPPPNGN